MVEFTHDSIIKAIRLIDEQPELRKGRESSQYDLIYDGKLFPPILVLSEASKILGGSDLTLNDFNNSTKQPFKILNDYGFSIVPKKSNGPQQQFDYRKFVQSCGEANLIISESLAIRFVASLITKPFVILTGLSGSGKTKLALAFSRWISSGGSQISTNYFSVGEEIKSNRVSYVVAAADNTSVTFVQPESGIKATFPYELINDWIETIRIHNYSKETSPRTIREQVEKITKYSPQLNSFETHLKAAAFYLISKETVVPESEIENVCLLPVGADWTNREPLVGYPNGLEHNKYVAPEHGALYLIINAINNPSKPFFLILDEMNLSHVERYFADFLSAMESKEPISLHAGSSHHDGIPPSIKLPNNLFVIGTVNIDETTYMFSPKVLDRANVIEFRVDESEMKNFLRGDVRIKFEKISGAGANMADDFINKCLSAHGLSQSEKDIRDDLLVFFQVLKSVGAEFGYRTASEILRFVAVFAHLNEQAETETILDAAIMQKLLPKLHGSRRKLEETLKSLAELCLKDKSIIAEVLNPKAKIDLANNPKIRYPISLEKIRRMNINLVNNNFTSYAEA